MKHLLRTPLLIVFALLCSQVSLAQEQAPKTDKPAASGNTQTAAEAKADQPAGAQDSKATLYFYRLKQYAGSALEPTVFCDDKQLARMDNGRYFGVKLDPGKHACNMGDKQTGFELDLKAGQVAYAKISIETGFWKGHGRLTLVQPEQGAFEIKKAKLLGTDKVKDRALVAIYEGSDK
ncbi:MAG: hypothetical protein V7641_250 [Blastocatellia bacterium]